MPSEVSKSKTLKNETAPRPPSVHQESTGCIFERFFLGSQTVVWERTAPENEIKSCAVVVICVTVRSPSSATSPEVDRAGATHPGLLRANPPPDEQLWLQQLCRSGPCECTRKSDHYGMREISGQTVSRHANPRPRSTDQTTCEIRSHATLHRF